MEQATVPLSETGATLRGAKALLGDAVCGVDGDLGSVRDIYFDDAQWTIRYFVVETGHWLHGRRVPVSPMALNQPEWGWPRLWISLTRGQVAESPELDLDRPISRREEMEYHRHYGWVRYWGGTSLWGAWATPAELVAAPEGPVGAAPPNAAPTVVAGQEVAAPGTEPAGATEETSHLGSFRRAIGYRIHATDGEIGHVADLIVDGKTWQIRYMEISTSSWWFGKKVLVSPGWIRCVDRTQRMVTVDLSRDEVRQAPPWDLTQPVKPEYERALHDYYSRLAPRA